MLDLVIRSDRVVTPAGVGACDVAIRGEKIVAVASSGTFGSDRTQRLIDATGKIVMRGAVNYYAFVIRSSMALRASGTHVSEKQEES